MLNPQGGFMVCGSWRVLELGLLRVQGIGVRAKMVKVSGFPLFPSVVHGGVRFQS